MKKIYIGLLGFGVVGSELAKIICNNKKSVMDKYNVELVIKKIFVKNLNKKRQFLPEGVVLTDNAQEIVEDNDISIICECVGGAGTDMTFEFVKKAVLNKKAIVMSSKKVLALYGLELLDTVVQKAVSFRYDATIGGGIPVAKIIRQCFKGEDIIRITGILNATSNYIYTRMEKDGFSFDEALKKAQELGYAENDPTEDINGYDAMYKAIVLMMFTMNIWIDIKELKTTPFSNINVLDMNYAEELGYSIKPLVVIEKRESIPVYRIGPCLVEQNHITANTFNNYNIVVLEGSNTGELGFYGQGAGSTPTASAMFDDLISIISEFGVSAANENMRAYSKVYAAKQFEEYTNNLYWRITVDNKIGRFASIATILSDNNVNIEKIIQKDDVNGRMGIVLLTSRVDRTTLDTVMKEFRSGDIEINTIMPFV